MGPLFGDQQQSARLYRFVSRFYDHLRPLFAGFPSTRATYYEFFDAEPEDHILDLGCGTGESTRELGERGERITGIDLSPTQLGVAAGKPALDGADFVVGDVMALPFADGTFDAVGSVGSLQHVPDVGRALAEAHRVTVDGGHLFVVGPKRPERAVPGRVADALMHFMRPAELVRLARAGGWTDVETRLVHMDYLRREALVVTATA
jgi:demethylmenaquinone methyltransferase/2-methoxy-6-polyprenyl-1,4-benzoquinol methylase